MKRGETDPTNLQGKQLQERRYLRGGRENVGDQTRNEGSEICIRMNFKKHGGGRWRSGGVGKNACHNIREVAGAVLGGSNGGNGKRASSEN